MSKPKIILIAGPTASGKSALALDLAGKNDGSIINADAMQIYDGLPILSAQPSPQEKKQAPHLLYGTLDPCERSSVGKWLRLAEEAICATLAKGRTPILVGGTGLYFRALLDGLAEIPAIPDNVRDVSQMLYKKLGEEQFRQELAALDPQSAKHLKKHDKQRLVRAYEVALHTGQPLSYWQKQTRPSLLTNYKIEAHLLMPPREKLYAACDTRFQKMIEGGAVEEAKAFLQRRIDKNLPVMKVLGLREIASYLSGQIKLDAAITAAQQVTRNYAKRQMTWFRNQWKL